MTGGDCTTEVQGLQQVSGLSQGSTPNLHASMNLPQPPPSHNVGTADEMVIEGQVTCLMCSGLSAKDADHKAGINAKLSRCKSYKDLICAPMDSSHSWKAYLIASLLACVMSAVLGR